MVSDNAQTEKQSAYAYYTSPNDFQCTFNTHIQASGKAYYYSLQMQYVESTVHIAISVALSYAPVGPPQSAF